ncbi:MAG: hypothetical protein JW999_02310 [Methanotrichaceae archaeon]|nr:hypothetical protein [Methanotrichaceae archaeon]
MAKKSEEITPSKKVLRESDNPIIEEYKEDLLNKPSYSIHPATDDEARLCRLEGLLAGMQEKMEDLEKRIRAIEANK